MSTFIGKPIFQCDGGAGQDESSSENETSETSVESSDEDEDTSDDEAENVNAGSEDKRRTTRSAAASSNDKPKGRITRQKTKEQTNAPTKRLLRSRKKSPVAGSGSKQPQVFPCPDCKKEFNNKVSVNKHRQWCKPKSSKASPRKKNETSKSSNKQDKPKSEDQQPPLPTVTPENGQGNVKRGRGRPRKSVVVATPPSIVVVQQSPVEPAQPEKIENDFIHQRSPVSSPGIQDTSSESDYEQREFAANVHVNNQNSNATIDVVNPDPPVDTNQSSLNVSDQVESSDGPVQCATCRMTYRTAQGYQNHLPTCVAYSSSDEDEEIDVQGFSENNELPVSVGQLSIQERTGFIYGSEEIPGGDNLQNVNEPTDVSSEESSSAEDNENEPSTNEVLDHHSQDQESKPDSKILPTEDVIPNQMEIEETTSSQPTTFQNDEVTANPNETRVKINAPSCNVGSADKLDSHVSVEIGLRSITVNPQLPEQSHWQTSEQPSLVKSAVVVQENRPIIENHTPSMVSSMSSNLQIGQIPPPPTQQPVSGHVNPASIVYQQQQQHTFPPAARPQTQQLDNSVVPSASGTIPAAASASVQQQYFQHTHQNTPTYTQAQLMPGTVVNSVMQMQQMSTSFHNQDSAPPSHPHTSFPISVNGGYMSSQNLIRVPNSVPNVTSTSLPTVQPNTILGNAAQDPQSHLFKNIDQRIPPPAQQQQVLPQQPFSQFPQPMPSSFPPTHFQGTGQPGHFSQQQHLYSNAGNLMPYSSTSSGNNMQIPGLISPQQQQHINGIQFQPNQIQQTIDSLQSKQLRIQPISSVSSQPHIMAHQQSLATQPIQANGSHTSSEGVQHQMHPSNFAIPHHQLPQSQLSQNQNQMQKFNGGNMAMIMQNTFNGQIPFSIGGGNNNPQPPQAVPYHLQQHGQNSQAAQPFLHHGQQAPIMHSMVQNQQDTNLLGQCGSNASHQLQNNSYNSMLQNGSHASQGFQQQQTQIHQQLYQGGHILPVMQQQQQTPNTQIQMQQQQQQDLQRSLQQHAQQNSQNALEQWNKSDIQTNNLQGQVVAQAQHQQTSSSDNTAVQQLNHTGSQQQLPSSAIVQQQLQASNLTAISQQQLQATNSTAIGQQQTQQPQTAPYIQQIVQLADGSTVILLAQPTNTTPGVISQNGVVSNNNNFQQTANVLNLLPGLQNIACQQQQQQQSPQLSPQLVQCPLSTNVVNGAVPHVGSVGRSAPCPCPACKEKVGTANALEKYKKVLPYPSEQGKQRQSSVSSRPILIRPGPMKPPQRTIRIQKAAMQSSNGNLVLSAQQPHLQQNSTLPPVRLVPLIAKAVPQATGMGVVMGSTESPNSSTNNRAPISNPNIAVVRPMENPLQKLSDQISQIESSFMSPQQPPSQPTTPTIMPQGPHLTLVTVSPPPPNMMNSPSQSPQIVAATEGFTLSTGSPIQQQVTQLLEITKSGISMDPNSIPQPRLMLVDHGTTSSAASLPSPNKTPVIRNGSPAGVKRKAGPTTPESGPNKSIKVTLRRKEGGDSYSINRITGSASGKGTMKSLKIKGQIKSGEQAGTLTDVVVVPVIHTVPIPDPDGDETESNRTIAEDGNGGNGISPNSAEPQATSSEESPGENVRLTHRAVIVYEVQCNDTVLFRSSDVRAVWGYIFETVQGTRLNHNLPPLSYPATNISLPQNEQEADASFNKTGLTHRAVQFLLEQLPGMKALASDYKFVKPASPNQLEDEPVQENESGCARTEIFTGRKPFDMFGWLASKHRKAPDATVCNVPLESAKNLSAPLSMRYRKLKEKVDISLVVWWSTIHGRGLYTKRDIEKGEMIIEYAGEVIRPLVCDNREKYYESKSIGCYMFRINDQVIDATMKGNAARFINHSCDPNCEAKAVKISGKDHILIFALRRVSRGEELTYDYKFEKEEEKIPCSCGSKNCRKYLN